MRNAECGMWNVECGMWNAECGMRNAECGMAFRILTCAFSSVLNLEAQTDRSGVILF